MDTSSRRPDRRLLAAFASRFPGPAGYSRWLPRPVSRWGHPALMASCRCRRTPLLGPRVWHLFRIRTRPYGWAEDAFAQDDEAVEDHLPEQEW